MVGGSFEDLRKKLKNQIVSMTYDDFQVENKKLFLGDEFKRDFNNIIEKCILSLMEGEDNFFGLFMIQVKRELSISIKYPISTQATLSHFIMYFNPISLLDYSFEEMKALIKHEIYHIMYGHLSRAKSLQMKYGKTAVNLAMDISVNQYIKNLPPWSAKLDNVRLAYNVELKEEETMEAYAEHIYKALKDIKSKNLDRDMKDNKDLFDFEDIHDTWDFNEQNISEDNIKELTNKTAKNANKSSLSPKGLEELLKGIDVIPEISWKDYLKRILPSMPYGKRKTITRKDRRQPNRLDLRGTLRNHVAQIIVAIDISGSITDKEIEQVMVEILGIVKNHEAEITVIECDDKIRRVYKINSKKDLKERLDKRGGTAFSPVFEYVNRKSLRNHLVIYFTDGMGEKELSVKPINYKTLWVLTGKGEKLSLEKPYGEIKRLKDVDYSQVDNTYGLKVMRELLHEWAR